MTQVRAAPRREGADTPLDLDVLIASCDNVWLRKSNARLRLLLTDDAGLATTVRGASSAVLLGTGWGGFQADVVIVRVYGVA